MIFLGLCATGETQLKYNTINGLKNTDVNIWKIADKIYNNFF